MRLVSIEAAAIAADVNEKTIRRWMAAGRLTRYERPGRIRVLVDAAELRGLLKPKASGQPLSTHRSMSDERLTQRREK